jgi:hypothetical protein
VLQIHHKFEDDAETVLSYQQASAQLGKLFGQPNGYVHAAAEIQAFKHIHGIS